MFNKIGGGLSGIGKKIRGDPEAAKEYLKEFEQFDYVHPHEGVPSLGDKAGITLNQKQSMEVAENLFAHNRVLPDKVFALAKAKDTFKIVYAEDKLPKKKHVITGKTANMNNRVVLCNKDGECMAVVVQDIHVSNQSYALYGISPLFRNQRSSSTLHYERKPLYCWARIDTANKKPKKLAIDMNTPKGFEFETYTMEQLELGRGILAEKPLCVKKNNKPAAVLRQGQFPDDIVTPAWDVSLAAGIDPLIIIGLLAVMDAQSV